MALANLSSPDPQLDPAVFQEFLKYYLALQALTESATANIGTGSGSVAAGNHTHQNTVITTGTNMSLPETSCTVVATADGLTLTLPACSTAMVGRDFTIILGVAGTVNINTQGSDTVLGA